MYIWEKLTRNKNGGRLENGREREKGSERMSKKEGEGDLLVSGLCIARLFIYFCFWVANALHTLDSFSFVCVCAHFSLSEGAAGRRVEEVEEK